MEDLILQYREGKKTLQDEIKRLKGMLLDMEDPGDMESLERDLSILNGMVRDMSENIQMMKTPLHKDRGQKNIFLMDPFMLGRLNIAAAAENDSEEDAERKKWMRILGERINSRIHLLTNKQKSTLQRWIFEEKTISQIAREDGVARQNVWERIFGSRTHPGALRKLRD